MKRTKLPLWPLLLAALALLVFFREQTTEAVIRGTDQCLRSVIPSLFPFFVLSNLLICSDFPDLLASKCAGWMQKCFHLPPIGAVALVIGLLGGYPIGAKTAAQLCADGRLTREQTEQLLAVCNNTGPAIFFGLAGGMLFQGLLIPLSMYLIHIASVVLTAWLLRPASGSFQTSAPSSSTTGASLTGAIWSGFVACGRISAFVIAFGIVIRLVFSLLPPLSPVWSSLLAGFLDLPNGIAALQAVSSEPLRFILCSMVVNWGGLCVHLQAKAVTESAGVSLNRHLWGKLAQTVIAGVLSISAACMMNREPLRGLAVFFSVIILIFLKTRVEILRKCRYNSYKAG